MQLIPVRFRGSVSHWAMVDDADAERMLLFRWRLQSVAGLTYAVRYTKSQGHVTATSMHRELMGDVPKSGDIDHIDGNGLNNQRSNLRYGTHALNMQNRRATVRTSPYRGVYWHQGKKKWMAEARLNGHKHHLGSFDIEVDAASTASMWRSIHMPYAVETAIAKQQGSM